MPSHDDIVKSVLALPEQQRAEVVREILESFEEQTTADVEKAWAEEVERRIRDLTNGKATTVPANEALDRARSRIKRL